MAKPSSSNADVHEDDDDDDDEDDGKDDDDDEDDDDDDEDDGEDDDEDDDEDADDDEDDDEDGAVASFVHLLQMLSSARPKEGCVCSSFTFLASCDSPMSSRC